MAFILLACYFSMALCIANVGVDPQTEILAPTNAERTKYCLAPLSMFVLESVAHSQVWDSNLALTADKHAQKCQFQTSLSTDRNTAYSTFLTQNNQPVPNGAYPNSLQVGENIAAVSSPQLVTMAPWSNISADYQCATDVCTGSSAGSPCNLYRQLIWNYTTRVGCARYLCDINNPFGVAGNWQFLVCNYWVAGNIAGMRPFPAPQCNGCTPAPTNFPTAAPTGAPTGAPTLTPAPTKAPTTAAPTTSPTNAPTGGPTTAPTRAPTSAPTSAPTRRVYPSPDQLNPVTEVLNPFNSKRQPYCLAALTYDAVLASTAATFAATCQFGGFTQNSINAAYATELTKVGQPVPNGAYPYNNQVGLLLSGADGGSCDTSAWTSEQDQWNCTDHTCSQGQGQCSNFEQIVWNESSKVGCSRYWCTANNPFGKVGVEWSYFACAFWVGSNFNQAPFPPSQCQNCVPPAPTLTPTAFTGRPSPAPTQTPTLAGQTFAPTSAPVATNAPTAPTKAPTTPAPSPAPTQTPGQTFAPTKAPTTAAPTSPAPTQTPTVPGQTFAPSNAPLQPPTLAPTQTPTLPGQTFAPTTAPTTPAPTPNLSPAPTQTPTVPGQTFAPSSNPTSFPTSAPTQSPAPTAAPTQAVPTPLPTVAGQTFSPTAAPTNPTPSPTQFPTAPGGTFAPSAAPTATAVPTLPGQTFNPTAAPTNPTPAPTQFPTAPGGTFAPTSVPTETSAPTLPGQTPAPTDFPTPPSNAPTQMPTVPGQTFAPTAPTPQPTQTPTLPGQTFAPTEAPTTPDQKPIANVTWTYKDFLRHLPNAVAALCRQALRADTKFFLQLKGDPNVNYFKRALSQANTSDTWTASITDADSSTTVYAEADALAKFLQEQPDVDSDSVAVSSNQGGGLSVLIIVIIVVCVVVFFLLILLIILIVLGVQAKNNRVQEKDRYDLL